MSKNLSPSIERFKKEMIKELPKAPNTKQGIEELEKKLLLQIIMAYVTWKIRTVPARKRSINIFRDGKTMCNFIKYKPDIQTFLDKVINGDDLNEHLSSEVRTHGIVLPSAGIKSQGKDIDPLVLREGLYHFHFGSKNEQNPKGRSNYLIFADVSNDMFTIVAIESHSVFEKGSQEESDFFNIRRMYIEKDIPRGQGYMLNPAMSSGHTIDIWGYAKHCNHIIENLDPKINNEDFISSLYEDEKVQDLQITRPKRVKLIWYFHDVSLGLLEKKSGHFFPVAFFRGRG